ncbi:hypothetical protein H9P43_007530 [Blastocladiella emersonii ATCC 22665]|nr:hypothetical protein H9P43_007530 [Blastocladiella emersonii ATCC 22665]
MPSPFIIGVAGGSASGKKDVCNYIKEKLSVKHPKLNRRMAIVSITDFYRPLTAEEMALAENGDYNFDHPDSFDWKLLEAFLADVANGRPTEMPKFDYIKKERIGMVPFPQADVILFEGILVLYKKKLRERIAMRLFVDVDSDVRLSSTVTRDTLGQKNRQVKPLDLVLNQWMRFNKPSFEDYVAPTKRNADVIIPRGFENKVALDILVHHIDEILTSIANVNPLSSPSLASHRGSIISTLSTSVAALALDKQVARNNDDDSDESPRPSAPASPTKGMHAQEDPLAESGELRHPFSQVPN